MFADFETAFLEMEAQRIINDELSDYESSDSFKQKSDEIKSLKIGVHRSLCKVIEESDAPMLAKIFATDVQISGSGMLEKASQYQNISPSIISILIENNVTIDGGTIADSKIMQNFIINGRPDLLKVVTDKFGIELKNDQSTEAIAKCLSSLKIDTAKKIMMIDSLKEMGFKFPPNKYGEKLSQILPFYESDEQLIKYVKKIEKKSIINTNILKNILNTLC